ncbi:hypothetical protein [Gynuella sp.]|uniref:hypothetical protein n=1 Tax=Gynuella sp. TaxID=2969146 RepID=UPI003D0C2C68
MRVCGFFLLFWMSGIAWAQDFGVAVWGQSRQWIMENETNLDLTPPDEENYLVYQANISGIQNVRLVYWFSDGLLIKGGFLFTNVRTDAIAAVNQFDKIAKTITGIYGQPDESNQLWQEDYPNKNGSIPIALFDDGLILQTVWHTSTTIIRQQLANKEGKFMHQLIYSPINPNILTGKEGF